MLRSPLVGWCPRFAARPPKSRAESPPRIFQSTNVSFACASFCPTINGSPNEKQSVRGRSARGARLRWTPRNHRQRASIRERDFRKKSVKRAVFSATPFNRNRLADGLHEVAAIHTYAPEPRRWRALEFPILHRPVALFCVDIDGNVRIHPLHLRERPCQNKLLAHVKYGRRRMMRPRGSARKQHRQHHQSTGGFVSHDVSPFPDLAGVYHKVTPTRCWTLNLPQF